MDLDPIERLMAERACERLIVEYSHRLDLGESTRVAERPAAMVEPQYIGEYHDRFVRTHEGWGFAFRRSDLAFAGGQRAGT